MSDPEDGSSVEAPAGTVTFVMTDVAGSTRLWEASGGSMAEAISRYYAIIGEVVAKNAGYRPIEQGEGDSTLAAFACATDAARAAAGIQRALIDEAWPEGASIHVRIGIHTGEAHLADGTYRGGTLNRCARIRSLGHPGQTLLSGTAADLVGDDLPPDLSLKDLGLHHLRDLGRSERVFQLVHPGVPAEFPPLRSSGPRSSLLPALVTSFIGREQEIAEVIHLLDRARLLTVVGAGGCGKTRLAIEVAERVKLGYRDGVVWVDLSSLADPDLVPSTVATALELREAMFQDPADTVAAYLVLRHVLLILDNCEHLSAACGAFAERILRSCAEVTILTTSREPLGVSSETSWRVPSLSLPSAGDARVEDSESVRLFLDRAERSRPRFKVTPEMLDAIASICRRVDGIPLAIELAAARTRMMSPIQIAQGIGERFSLLAGGVRTALPRQRTLEASIDWSYELLSEPQRILFRRLAIFAGGFTLEAAEQVCSGDPIDELGVLDVLSQLVDRSLVHVEEIDDEPRYRLLETVRDYARQKLAGSQDGAGIRDRHLRYFVAFVERGEEGLQSRDMTAWVSRMQHDHDNVRAAMDWSVESRNTGEALRLCAASFLFWLYGNHLPEGRRRVDGILALEGGDPGLRARALAAAAGTATFVFQDPETVLAFAEPALMTAEELGDGRTVGRAATHIGFALIYGDPSAARDYFGRAADAAEEVGDWVFVCNAFAGLTIAESFLGERERASEAARNGTEAARAIDHPFHLAQISLWDGGVRALAFGEFETAASRLSESVEIARMINDDFLLSFALAYRGRLEVWRGRYPEAVQHLEEALKIASAGGLIFQLGVAQMLLAECACAEGDPDRAYSFAQTSLPAMRFSGMSFAISSALVVMSGVRELRGDLAEARGDAEEAVEIARTNRLPLAEADALLLIGWFDLAEGSVERAEENFHRALGVAGGSGLPLQMVAALEGLAGVADAQESPVEATRLLGAASAARDEIGYRAPRLRGAENARRIDSLRDSLGAEAFGDLWNEGAALRLEDAVAYATRARGERRRPSHGWSGLTPTELEVVKHVAEGLTNPQIADRMFIATGTVKTHLKHIFEKLGVKTRSELAAQASRRDQ